MCLTLDRGASQDDRQLLQSFGHIDCYKVVREDYSPIYFGYLGLQAYAHPGIVKAKQDEPAWVVTQTTYLTVLEGGAIHAFKTKEAAEGWAAFHNANETCHIIRVRGAFEHYIASGNNNDIAFTEVQVPVNATVATLHRKDYQ